jgi:peroxiredoxin
MRTEEERPASHVLRIGEPAPDFALCATTGNTIRLGQYRGDKTVLLVFFTYAFVGASATLLRAVDSEVARWRADDVEVLGVGADALYTLQEWARSLELAYPLLSDSYPYTRIASLYGLSHSAGVSGHALFLVDKRGRLAWAHVQQAGEATPDVTNLSAVVRQLAVGTRSAAGVRGDAPRTLAS